LALLETLNLTKYFGGLGAVQDLDLSVAKGEVLSIIGPNGAGKTTLFNLLTGFLQPTKGEIIYRGEEITNFSTNQIAQKGIVRTFQSTKVFPGLTVLQGIRIGCHKRVQATFWDIIFCSRKFREEKARLAAEVSSILEFTGLDSKKDARARDLSYGEQRRLEVAVALGAYPEVLLLDEPASGMNPEEINRMMDLVSRIKNQGITVVLVEHNMRMVMDVSDRIVCLNYGKKIAEGTPQEIQICPEVIEAYLGRGGSCVEIN